MKTSYLDKPYIVTQGRPSDFRLYYRSDKEWVTDHDGAAWLSLETAREVVSRLGGKVIRRRGTTSIRGGA